MALSLPGAVSHGAGVFAGVGPQPQCGTPLLQPSIHRYRPPLLPILGSAFPSTAHSAIVPHAVTSGATGSSASSSSSAAPSSSRYALHTSCQGRRYPTHRSPAPSVGSVHAFSPGYGPSGAVPVAHTRLHPASTSGAASAGTSDGRGLHPHGSRTAAGQSFNPRYHSNRYQQPHPQQHSEHQHPPPTPVAAARGAWTTPRPLSPGPSAFAPADGVTAGTGPSNPRYDALRSPTLSSGGPAPRLASGPAEESLLVAGAVSSATRSPGPSSSSSTASQSQSPSSTLPVPVAAAGRRGRSQPQPLDQPGAPGPDSQLSGSVSRAQGASPRPQAPDVGALASSGVARPFRARTQLERLHIRDFALVSEQTVCFGPGVNVVTGESGSGKSVLVEAFSQVLGAAAPQECVRAPAEVAVIEGTFLVGEEQQPAVVQLLTSCGLPQRALVGLMPVAASAAAGGNGGGADAAAADLGGQPQAIRLTIRREISQAAAGGLRSRVFLNGAASSLRVLRELGALLVDTNGQHSSMSLRDANTQLDLLDRIAGTSPLADSYAAALARLRDLEGRLDELDELDDEGERARMQKLVDAVAKLRVRAGEEHELRRMLKKMEARRSAVEQCGLVRMALCGEGGGGGVTDALRTIEAQLNAILATEEQNRAAAKAKGNNAAKAADGEGSSAHPPGEDEAAEEEDEGEAEGAAAGARMMEEALEQVALAKDMLAASDGMVRSYARRYQFSQADHDATSERLARIERLMKQASAAGFGGGGGGRGAARIATTEQLLEAAEECSSKLATYYEMEGQREDWEAQLEALVPELRSLALQLSARRRAAAAALRSAVESCLRELSMGGSRFDVRIGWAEERVPAGGAPEGLFVGEEEAEEAGVSELGGCTYVMGPRGLDQVEFLLAAGPAEPLRPLAAVASGGESARVMLALKAAPAQAAAAAAAAQNGAEAAPHPEAATPMAGAGVPILILDELDSGIGARLGSAVGSILARMALPTHGSNSQIICVTHLPQVACFAAHHIKVQKDQRLELRPAGQGHSQGSAAAGEQEDGVGGAAAAAARVTTSFVPLTSFEERCEEVAAMLGLGDDVAREMLVAAQTQVAAMYPAGAAPAGILLAPAAPAAAATTTTASQTRHRVTVAAGAVAGASSEDGDLSPRDNVLRVVQNALRSDELPYNAGGGAGGGDGGGMDGFGAGSAANASRRSFMVSVSPSMDTTAALGGGGGGDAAAAASQPSGRGRAGSADEGDEEAEVEAELSARLLAGFEAAALEHLTRMEAQAKAAAAAAAAAAVAVGGKGTPEAAVALQPLTAVPVLAAGLDEVPAEVAADGGGGGAEGLAATLQAEARDEDHRGKREADGGDSMAAPGTRLPAPAGPTDMPAPETTTTTTAYGGAEGNATAVAVPSVSSSSSGGGFVVAVQPARSPLPYSFGGGGSSSDEEDDYGGVDRTPHAPDNAEEEHEPTAAAPDTNSRNWPGSGAAAPSGNGHPHPYLQQQMTYDSPYMGAAYGQQSYSSGGGDVPAAAADVGGGGYMYNLGVPSAGSGGQFVSVPEEHEVEYNEMFQAIMSFSLEDYAGEAMRTYEDTLWQALRDCGLA